jgi:uncharacterized protein (TIGR00730 family)
MSKYLSSVSVQCGASMGSRPEFAKAARRLGTTLAGAGICVVYGGVRTGLMGCLADAVLENGGRIIGVVPRLLLERGLAHEGLSELRIVETMHERKSLMLELADATISLPGGVGTMDEFWEVLAGAQLGLHCKPCGILNSDGYYDLLLAFMDHALAKGLLSATDKSNVIVTDNPESLLAKLSESVAGRRATSNLQEEKDRRTTWAPLI